MIGGLTEVFFCKYLCLGISVPRCGFIRAGVDESVSRFLHPISYLLLARFLLHQCSFEVVVLVVTRVDADVEGPLIQV
jgi:hypothetical protein